MTYFKMKKRKYASDGTYQFRIDDVKILKSRNGDDYAKLIFEVDSGATFSAFVFTEFNESNVLSSAVYDYCQTDQDNEDMDLGELFNATGQVTTKLNDKKYVEVMDIKFDES